MSHKAVLFTVVLLCCLLVASTAFADVKLPDPKKDGGEGIFNLLERRASGVRENFPKGEISREDLSVILWAASGLNRGGKAWTVPLAGGRPPYVKIYAVMPDGAFLYDWKEHSLFEVTSANVLEDITGDAFVKEAPCVLVFVSDPGDLGNMARSNAENTLIYNASFNAENTLAYIASGAMTQNVYLAADALGISGRYMISMKADSLKQALKLKDSDSPLCVMPLGKR